MPADTHRLILKRSLQVLLGLAVVQGGRSGQRIEMKLIEGFFGDRGTGHGRCDRYVGAGQGAAVGGVEDAAGDVAIAEGSAGRGERLRIGRGECGTRSILRCGRDSEREALGDIAAIGNGGDVVGGIHGHAAGEDG